MINVWWLRYFTYASAYTCDCFFSASSLPCFDPDIQYSFTRCVIAPPTIRQWKHGKSDNSINGGERVKDNHVFIHCVIWFWNCSTNKYMYVTIIGYLFTRKWCFGGLNKQTFENWFQRACFWKQYHYHLHVNYENTNLWKWCCHAHA